MLKKRTEKQASKFVLTLEKSLLDRIERVREVAHSQGYEISMEETLVRCITLAVARAEKILGLGANAAAGARKLKQTIAAE